MGQTAFVSVLSWKRLFPERQNNSRRLVLDNEQQSPEITANPLLPNISMRANVTPHKLERHLLAN